MNGSKIRVDVQEAGVVVGERGRHHHTHGVVKLVKDLDITKTIEADVKLAQDHSHDRASFQGRFRKTAFGDFKHMPGRSPEFVEASIEDHEREDKKVELETAAAASGVVLEGEMSLHQEIDLHRLADDGGLVHE